MVLVEPFFDRVLASIPAGNPKGRFSSPPPTLMTLSDPIFAPLSLSSLALTLLKDSSRFSPYGVATRGGLRSWVDAKR